MAIVWAIIAACGWGVADLLARVASEKIGSRSTVFFAQLCSFTVLILVLVLTKSDAASVWPMSAIAYVLTSAVLDAIGMTLFYEALRRGPVSLVSPIASAFGGVTALLALASGERASGWQLAGFVAILLGIGGSTTTFGTSPSPHASTRRGGVTLAILVAVIWGGAFFLLTPAFSAFGSILPILICRAVTVFGHAAYSVGRRQRWSLSWSAVPVLVGIGLLDTGAFVAYGASVQCGNTSMTVIIASLFSTITVLLAAVVLRERLRRTQWVAVAVLLVGIGLAARA